VVAGAAALVQILANSQHPPHHVAVNPDWIDLSYLDLKSMRSAAVAVGVGGAGGAGGFAFALVRVLAVVTFHNVAAARQFTQ
jgi:hypothetical protein